MRARRRYGVSPKDKAAAPWKVSAALFFCPRYEHSFTLYIITPFPDRQMVSISITFRVETPSCHAGQPVMRPQACTTWGGLEGLSHFQYLGFVFCLPRSALPASLLSLHFASYMALILWLLCKSRYRHLVSIITNFGVIYAIL